jgi:hypothetical protein
MHSDDDDLAASTRSWEGRVGTDAAAAARVALATLCDEKAEAEAGEATRGYDVGRCLVIATPREIEALRAAAGAVDSGAPVFGICAVELDHEGQATIEPAEIARTAIATSDAGVITDFIASDTFFVFDEAALALVDEKLRRLAQTPVPSVQARLLAPRARAVGETATESLFTLGHDGGAMLERPALPKVVTPGYACAWMAEILGFVLGIERQKRRFEETPPIATAEPVPGNDALGCRVWAAGRSLPGDHVAAANHVLRRLLPPAD